MPAGPASEGLPVSLMQSTESSDKVKSMSVMIFLLIMLSLRIIYTF